MSDLLRVRVLDQDTGVSLAELTVYMASVVPELEIRYPDGKTIRYSREID